MLMGLSIDTKMTCDYLTDEQYYILGNFNQYGQSGIMLHPDNPDNVVFTYYLNNESNRIILGQTNEILHIITQNNLIYVNNRVITSFACESKYTSFICSVWRYSLFCKCNAKIR